MFESIEGWESLLRDEHALDKGRKKEIIKER